MTDNQTAILWIGLILVLVYLFTDKSFSNTIFNRSTSGTPNPPVTNAFLATLESGIPNSSASTGKAKVVTL
jgi:hypothetical protein